MTAKFKFLGFYRKKDSDPFREKIRDKNIRVKKYLFGPNRSLNFFFNREIDPVLYNKCTYWYGVYAVESIAKDSVPISFPFFGNLTLSKVTRKNIDIGCYRKTDEKDQYICYSFDDPRFVESHIDYARSTRRVMCTVRFPDNLPYKVPFNNKKKAEDLMRHGFDFVDKDGFSRYISWRRLKALQNELHEL